MNKRAALCMLACIFLNACGISSPAKVVNECRTTTVLYTASEEVLRATDALKIKLIRGSTCVEGVIVSHPSHRSTGEIFDGLMKERGIKSAQQTVLKISQETTSDLQCPSIWFTYSGQ